MLFMAYRQGKAIVQFPSVEAASAIVNLCEKDIIKINNVLPIHPSYCFISKPSETKEVSASNVVDSMDGNIFIKYIILFRYRCH